jgi:hypothetical protein
MKSLATLCVAIAPDAIEVLREQLLALEKVLCDFPGLRDEVLDLLGPDFDLLAHGFVELHSMPTAGAESVALSFHVTNKFLELVSAVSTGDVERLRVYRLIHGGSREK